jgi:hypothetical protein
MRRRRLLLAAGLLACCTVAIGLHAWLTYPNYRIDRETYAKLLAMHDTKVTLSEVESILGGPAHFHGRYYDRYKPDVFYFWNSGRYTDPVGWHWIGDGAAISVYIGSYGDSDGCLAGLTWHSLPKETFWAKCLRVLGL